MKIRFRLLLWVHFVFMIVSCLFFFFCFYIFLSVLSICSFSIVSFSISFFLFQLFQSRRILLRSLEAMLIQTQDDSDSQLSCPYLPTYRLLLKTKLIPQILTVDHFILFIVFLYFLESMSQTNCSVAQ